LIFLYLVGIIYFGGSDNLTVFNNFSVPLINLVVAAALFYTAFYSKRYGRRYFYAWVMLGIAQTLYATGDFIYGILEVFYGVQPFPSIADVFYTLFYPFFAIGLIVMTRLKSVPIEPYKHYKNIFDALIIVLALAMVIQITLFTMPVVTDQLGFISFAISTGYIFMDLLLLFILVYFLFNLSSKTKSLPFLLLSVGIGLKIAGDIGFFFENLLGTYEAGNVVDLIFVISCSIIGVAAMTQISSYGLEIEKSLLRFRSLFKSEVFNYLPLLAILFAFITIIISYYYSLSNFYVFAWAVSIIIALALIRQILTFKESKKVQNMLMNSLQEKDVLIKEVHHRVKNNMQIITSLFNLQQNSIKDPDSLTAFLETKNRVKTMAMVHENLYNSEDLSNLDIGNYIENLLTNLYRANVTNQELVRLEMDVERVNIDINTAIPLGLIINELVTNSLKYAFPEGKKGDILLGLYLENEEYSLIVSDNGVGFPEEIDFKNTDSLGMQLVNTLVAQLDGNIILNRNNGTEFIIKF
jgi:two-component sensor histidine kinase